MQKYLSEFQALQFGEAEAPEIEKMEEDFIKSLTGKICNECNGIKQLS